MCHEFGWTLDYVRSLSGRDLSLARSYLYKVLRGQDYIRADAEAGQIATFICAMKGVAVKPYEVSRYVDPPTEAARWKVKEAQLKMFFFALAKHQGQGTKPKEKKSIKGLNKLCQKPEHLASS